MINNVYRLGRENLAARQSIYIIYNIVKALLNIAIYINKTFMQQILTAK